METSSPASVLPSATRPAPMSRTASVPRLGSASIIGSNSPRTRPTATRPSRSSSARAPNRSVSAASRPSVLTTSAASKLSWAISLTSARSCCARCMRGLMTCEYTTLTTNTSGKTTSPTSGEQRVGERPARRR